MNHQGIQLLKDLKAAGIVWNVRHEVTERQGRQRVIKESVLLVSMTVPSEEGPVTYEEPMQLNWDCSLDAALAMVMRKHLKGSPIYRAWLEGHGNVPVQLVAGVLECVPEAVHTALRKLATGPTSWISYNAIHQLHSYDRGLLWQSIESLLREEFGDAQKVVMRRKLATQLTQAVRKTLEDALSARLEDLEIPGRPGRRYAARTAEERFALLAMISAAELTDMNEWMYGWLGFLVKDAPDVQVDTATLVAETRA